MFADRIEAGEKLVLLLQKYMGETVVLAIPRGGVLTAFPIAKALGVSLSLAIVRKLGVPGNEEQGFGAVDSDGQVTLNSRTVHFFGISDKQIREIADREKKVIDKRIKIYAMKLPDLADKTAILVDDGLATGYTMLSAINFVRRRKPKRIIVAVPTAHVTAYNMVKKAVDEIYCLEIIETELYAVGLYYADFHEVDHEEIKNLLANG